jgi:hypothetical protein
MPSGTCRRCASRSRSGAAPISGVHYRSYCPSGRMPPAIGHSVGTRSRDITYRRRVNRGSVLLLLLLLLPQPRSLESPTAGCDRCRRRQDDKRRAQSIKFTIAMSAAVEPWNRPWRTTAVSVLRRSERKGLRITGKTLMGSMDQPRGSPPVQR